MSDVGLSRETMSLGDRELDSMICLRQIKGTLCRYLMQQRINTYLLPDLVDPQELDGATVVVIDVLRATTTIICALVAGAKEIIPCQEVDEAKVRANELTGDILLGGERGGLRIEGFDLGNSPAEYSSPVVSQKSIVFTTTNGTRAMMCCQQARRVLIGAFVNLSALCRDLAAVDKVALVCAGTQGHVTLEDALFAGAAVERLRENRTGRSIIMNDQTSIALAVWNQALQGSDSVEKLTAVLADSGGGHNVQAIGMAKDIEFAATKDRFNVVPELNIADWRIYLP